MEFSHVVVWLDHSEAHIINFNREDAEERSIKAAAGHTKRRMDGKANSPEHTHYLDEIAAALAGADEILIVGPGPEKLALSRHLMKRHPETTEKVVGVETADHPSDRQLLAYARKYFRRVDQLL